MRTIARTRFVGVLAGTALVLGVRLAGFAPPPTPALEHSSGLMSRPLSLPPADFNADGQPDVASVVSTGADGGAIHIVAAGCGTIDLPLARPLAGVTAADYDKDGDLDVIGLGLGGRLYVWQNEGGCRLLARTPFGPRSSSGRGPWLGAGSSAGDSLRPVEAERLGPPVRRALRIRADASPRLLRLAGRPQLPRSLATDAEFSRPPPPRRLASS